ncbi:MAG: hypothetical protein B6242_15060 [Anaerolineaceae bacterium 4572_78]|nr:MAG: hypothetical protein B6242_15060 [Anaerolineaceae bacterium 4572_78]
MDRIVHYQNLIKHFFESYTSIWMAPPQPPYDIMLAFDDHHRQYMMRELGWTESRRIHRTILHVVLKNDKIWIEEDMTEDGIATYFLEQGVPRNDIVLGFQHPSMRPFTEFAVE